MKVPDWNGPEPLANPVDPDPREPVQLGGAEPKAYPGWVTLMFGYNTPSVSDWALLHEWLLRYDWVVESAEASAGRNALQPGWPNFA